MNRLTPLLLALIVALMPLSGCISDGVDGTNGETGPTGPQGLPGSDGSDGTDGTDGTNGTNGVDGADGADGTDGVNGTDGVDGKTTLIQTFIEYPVEFCPGGGVGLHVGIDDDNDAYLSIDEVDETVYVCDGADGEDGQDGADGTGGNSGGGGTTGMMLSDSIRLSKSDGCPAGGRLLAFGLDNGDNGGTAGNGVLESGEIDDQTTYCSSQRVSFVDDARPGATGSKPVAYQGMRISIEDTLYFAADDGVHGYELWGYNTTTDEMWMVADIRQGAMGSFPGYLLAVKHGTQLFFGAYTDDNGTELWAHDHSTGTTWMAANLGMDQPSPSGSNPGDDIEIMYGDTLYFSAFTQQYATELWAYNPVTQQSWLVQDIHLGSSANPGWYMHFIHNDVLYFTARDIGNVHDLWGHNHSNGTTWKVAVFGTDPNTHPGNYMDHLVGDTVYFDALTPLGRELMAYNLLNHTSWLVADLELGQVGSNPGEHMSLVVGDTLLFDTADDSLWAHDTSNGTTWRVMQHLGTNAGEGTHEAVVGTMAFFQAQDAAGGQELWSFDAQTGQAFRAADLVPGPDGSSPGQNMMVGLNGVVYFDASTHSTGRELWAHDPADGSTWVVADIAYDDPNATTTDPSSNPARSFWAFHNGCLFFDAYESQTGREMWKMCLEHTVSYGL
ncbi:MAG: hypothetical protein VX451_01900 [Candidatus Thermoplasmatota archaeon]|nr:hypothetical protein [Candidatus Thermoplasmatota archaeon]